MFSYYIVFHILPCTSHIHFPLSLFALSIVINYTIILPEHHLLFGTFGFSPVFSTENQRMSKGHKKMSFDCFKVCFSHVFVQFPCL